MSKYKGLYRPNHPLSSKTGYVSEHRFVLFDTIGPGTHHCHWCGTDVTWIVGKRTSKGSLVVDHLDDNASNNIPSNLVPSCHSCNCSRNKSNKVQDHEIYKTMTRNYGRHRAELRICKTCGKEFPHIKAEKRPNRGQYCSPNCMYVRKRKKQEL